MRALLPNASVSMARDAAGYIRRGDEVGTSIGFAKTAGIYPAGYRLEPCAVERDLAEGDRVAIGDLQLECIDTRGHAGGQPLVPARARGTAQPVRRRRRIPGGRSSCRTPTTGRLEELIASLRKLRGLELDALFPGHFAFSLRDGQQHIERANEALDRLLIPPQAVSAW